jgi:hypothetical protein
MGEAQNRNNRSRYEFTLELVAEQGYFQLFDLALNAEPLETGITTQAYYGKRT